MKYYHLNTTNSDYNNTIKALQALHKIRHPNNALSIRYSNDTNEAIVKVDIDIDDTVSSSIIRAYGKSEHPLLLDMIYTNPAWMDSNKTEEVYTAIENKATVDKETLRAG